MAGITENYGLTIQGIREKYDVDILNRNFRKLDNIIKNLDDSKPNPEDVINSYNQGTFICDERLVTSEEALPLEDILAVIIGSGLRWISFASDTDHITGLPIESGTVQITIHGTSAAAYLDDSEDGGEENYIIICDRTEAPYDHYMTLFNTESGLDTNWVKTFTTSDIQNTVDDNNDNPVSSNVTHELHERLTVVEDKAPVMKTGLVDMIIAKDTVKGKILIPCIMSDMKTEGEPSFDKPAKVSIPMNPFSIRNYGKNVFPYMELRVVGGVKMYQDAAGIHFDGGANMPIMFELEEMNIIHSGETYYLKANHLTDIQEISLSVVNEGGEYTKLLSINPDKLEDHAEIPEFEEEVKLSFQITIAEGTNISTCIRVACTRGVPSDEDLFPTVNLYEIRTPYPLVAMPVSDYNTEADFKHSGIHYIANTIKSNFRESYFWQRVGYEFLDRDSWIIYKEEAWTENYALFQNKLSQEAVGDDVNTVCFSSRFKPIPMNDMVDGKSLELINEDAISVLSDNVVIAVRRDRFETDITPSELDKLLIDPVDIYYQLKNPVKTVLEKMIDIESFDGDTSVVISKDSRILMDIAYGENKSGQDVLTAIASLLGN